MIGRFPPFLFFPPLVFRRWICLLSFSGAKFYLVFTVHLILDFLVLIGTVNVQRVRIDFSFLVDRFTWSIVAGETWTEKRM